MAPKLKEQRPWILCRAGQLWALAPENPVDIWYPRCQVLGLGSSCPWLKAHKLLILLLHFEPFPLLLGASGEQCLHPLPYPNSKAYPGAPAGSPWTHLTSRLPQVRHWNTCVDGRDTLSCRSHCSVPTLGRWVSQVSKTTQAFWGRD